MEQKRYGVPVERMEEKDRQLVVEVEEGPGQRSKSISSVKLKVKQK